MFMIKLFKFIRDERPSGYVYVVYYKVSCMFLVSNQIFRKNTHASSSAAEAPMMLMLNSHDDDVDVFVMNLISLSPHKTSFILYSRARQLLNPKSLKVIDGRPHHTRLYRLYAQRTKQY